MLQLETAALMCRVLAGFDLGVAGDGGWKVCCQRITQADLTAIWSRIATDLVVAVYDMV